MSENQKELSDSLYALIGLVVVCVVVILLLLAIRPVAKHREEERARKERRERAVRPRKSHRADSIAICQKTLDLAELKSFDLMNEDGQVIIPYPNVFMSTEKFGYLAWGDIELRAWIVSNKNRKTSERLVSQYKNLSYKLIKRDFYIVSWAHDGVIVYEKTLLSGKSLFVVQLVYPDNYKELMEPQVKRISKLKMQ